MKIRKATLILISLIVIVVLLLHPNQHWIVETYAAAEQESSFLTTEEYATLDEMFRVHLNHFLNSEVITTFGLPLTAYKAGDRKIYSHSNPTEWGYALQAWIAGAERGIISQTDVVNKISTALTTMQTLQQDPNQNYGGLFYPFYTLLESTGNEKPSPIHDANVWIPSGDNALLYASILITEGWARNIGNTSLETQARDVKNNMDFQMFLFQDGDQNTYLAHLINADTDALSSSKWDVFADEGGVVTWIAYLSGSISFETFKALTESQLRKSAKWQSCLEESFSVEEAAWFNAMFTWGVRSFAGFSISTFDITAGASSRYSKYSFVPNAEAHLAYGDCLGVDYPAFSDAMSQSDGGQGLVGRYTPPSLAGQAPSDPPNHVTPHAFFIPFNAGPDLSRETIARLVSEIDELKNDQAGYFHDSGLYPFGFEVVVSPYSDDMAYDGADQGRQVFETLSQAYIVLSLFNSLQLDDGNLTFYQFATRVPNYEDKLHQVLAYLYSQQIYIPIVLKPPCFVKVFRFGSGNSAYPEERNITINESCFNPGENTVLLENINPPEENRWLFWDSLSLEDSTSKIIWKLGENEAPPNYSDDSFDEFDSAPPYNSHFYIDTMTDSEFPAELNDDSFSQVFIHFNLTESQANGDLTLFLDTLYATHTAASYFDMKVQVITGK